MKYNEKENDEIEIDLRELFFALKRKIFLILAVALIFSCVSGAVTAFFIKPVYTSTSSVLVLSKETTLTSIADLQLGTQLANDYQILIKSTSVLEDVIENLELDIEVEDLRETITVDNPTDTRILEITVENNDAVLAKEIVDEIAEVSSDYVGDKMEVVPPKIIELGKIPTEQTSPSMLKNVLLAFLIGAVLCAGVITVLTVLDDTIKSEDDLINYLNIPVLASVPDRKDYINTKKSKKRLQMNKK